MSTVTPFIHTWTPGTYILINARSNSVVDLNAADRRSVIGFQLHGGLNQHWEFIPEPGGDGYTIRSIWIDLYTSIEGDARENASIVATDRQTVWDVERTNEGLSPGYGSPSAGFRRIPPDAVELSCIHLKATDVCRYPNSNPNTRKREDRKREGLLRSTYIGILVLGQ